MRKIAGLLIVTVLLGIWGAPAKARAVSPLFNTGKIVFLSSEVSPQNRYENSRLSVAFADGTIFHRLLQSLGDDQNPHVLADHEHIVFGFGGNTLSGSYLTDIMLSSLRLLHQQNISLMPDGSHIWYVQSLPAQASNAAATGFYVADADGTHPKLLAHLSSFENGFYSPSPDEKTLLRTTDCGNQTECVQLINFSNETVRSTTLDAGLSVTTWSPDSQYVLVRNFQSEDLYVLRVSDLLVRRLVAAQNDSGFIEGLTWLPNSKGVIYEIRYPTAHPTGSLHLVSLDGTHLALTPLQDGSEDEYPVFSPDGRRIAFARDQPFDHKICIINIDGSQEHCPVEIGGFFSRYGFIRSVIWSPDGKQLAFVDDDDALHNPDRAGVEAILVADVDYANTPRLVATWVPEDDTPIWVP